MPTSTVDKPNLSRHQEVAPSLEIDEVLLKRGALVFRAINHKLRQKMMQLIAKAGMISVTEIYVKLRIEQSVTSQHLAILRAARLVTTKRDGKKIYYSVNYNRLEELHEAANALVTS